MIIGFLISPGSIPSYWIWMYWLCPLHYTIEGILSTQFHDDDRVILALDGITKTTVSAYFHEFFGGKYSYDHRGYDVLALFIFIVVARLLFFYAAAYVRHEKR
jgi:ABC-type multidrug transport system permease subunit